MRSILPAAALLAALCGCASVAPDSSVTQSARPKNVIFFLGDGMGMNTLTAARIFAVGEEGQLTLDTLPESAFVKTFARDAQVTDSAASMSAYMTGVKVNNGVIAMSADTMALAPGKDKSGNATIARCINGAPVPTLGELARRRGLAVGVVTTTRVTDATPAAVYAHACDRGMETDIAAALVPGGAGYNSALGAGGIDVLFGGGTSAFQSVANGGKRADGRDLLAEMQARGISTALNAAQFRAIDRMPAAGLFAATDMSYDAVRDPAREPSLADMAGKAVKLLSTNPNGFFLVVEGGLIDHALHDTQAKRALQEVVAFDNALKAVISQMQGIDPGLRNTLIVVTADHDHTLHLNGYARRTGKTTDTEPGVLGLVRRVSDGKPQLDLDGRPYTIIGFGTGEHRVQGARSSVAPLTDALVAADGYHQEAVVRTAPGSETHGGTDVYLGAIGAGAHTFHGTIDNTRVFELIKAAAGW
ncbi:alkaline phosphatase [Massilia sp. PAMC28688]|uniref:alkaline phosphatase n=1 Tax=Massilia sp. PAMC28688 TaxID=2861283 RepID=UPI001C6329FE|nr:alkaline phosphatase [Massilia sp. PAMC28688]QYF91586.1 alkaline phosphatase [Massilia sp. PAMC28688]